jgi:type IV secretory pathway ATPase VirB11/archaellum biosynthesis ATPase
MGLGPIEAYMRDPTVSDILVNTYRQIYVERYGKLEKTEARFKDDAHLRRIIDKIVSAVGRRIDESSPMVDARLADGSRVNAIIKPLSIDGPMLSIRRFAVDPLELEDLIGLRTLTTELGALFKGIVRARLNVMISGGTGSGKTTLLNVLSRFIPANERIITIEDSAELQLKQDHVVRLETKPPNIEGRGEVTARDLVRNSLRRRTIIMGEVRTRRPWTAGYEHGPRWLSDHHPRQYSSRRPHAPRDDRIDGRAKYSKRGYTEIRKFRNPRPDSAFASCRRDEEGSERPRDRRHGRRRSDDAGDIRLPANWHRQ